MNEQSPELEEGFNLLRGFATAVFGLLRKALSDRPFIPPTTEFVAFAKPGEWSYQTSINRDYSSYIKQNLVGDALWGLPEAIAFARWFHSHPAVPGPRNGERYKRDFDEAMISLMICDLLVFLRDYLRRGGPVHPIDEELLQSSWREIGELCQKPKTRYVFLIEGLQIEEPLDLGPFGTLVPLTPEEKTLQFKYHWWEVGPCSIADVSECQAQLIPAPLGIRSFSAAASVVMTALRLAVSPHLYGYGPIGLQLTDRVGEAFASSPIHEFATPSPEHGEFFCTKSVPTTLLSPVVYPRIREICDGLRSRALDSFAIAFRRFNLALRRQDVEDRIVDLAVVLESTLLAGCDHELTWRALKWTPKMGPGAKV
jgi:hypothetical protein